MISPQGYADAVRPVLDRLPDCIAHAADLAANLPAGGVPPAFGAAHSEAFAAPQPRDPFVVASQSGINGSVVEQATLVTDRGHHLIAVTSAEHTARVQPRHPGRRLADIADVVPANGAPYGDALLPTACGGAVCAVPSVTAALLAQLLTAEVVRRFHLAGEVPHPPPGERPPVGTCTTTPSSRTTPGASGARPDPNSTRRQKCP